jgi:hypothetical protein
MIMQDFFKETNLRDKLQEQCDDLSREVDNLHSEKSKLRKQLADAQAAIVEKDKTIAGGTEASPSEHRAHTILVEDMEKKFARENKQLEEQVREAIKGAVLPFFFVRVITAPFLLPKKPDTDHSSQLGRYLAGCPTPLWLFFSAKAYDSVSGFLLTLSPFIVDCIH